MKNISNITIATVCALGISISALAGNKDRSGQSGAPELSINPWARTTGLFGQNTACVGGIEAMKVNIAGLAKDTGLEFGLSHSVYLSGTGININNIAVATKIGESNTLGINLMSMTFGDIPVTDYYNPEGFATYKPQFLNLQVGFAHEFTKWVSIGMSATYVSEQINNINALGLAFDGGIQYKTGKRDNFHFGIALRNIGTNMRFTGTGFSVNADQPQSDNSFAVTARYPSEKFELPTSLNIGGSYDFYLDEKKLKDNNSMPMHRLSVLANFTSNSFNNDYLGGGLEYGFHNMVMLRASYRYEKGIGGDNSTTMFTGLAAGATVQKRLGDGGPVLAIDYSYRPTQRPANGVHVMSLRFTR